MRLEFEISESCAECLRIVKAVNAGRATAHAKKPEEIREAFENAHRLTALAVDEIITKALSQVQ